MNEISEIENRNLSIHQKNQLDKQNSKNNNQKQETDKLFEECTKLFQTNDKWKGSVQKRQPRQKNKFTSCFQRRSPEQTPV